MSGKNAVKEAVAGLALYALSPYGIQSSMVLEIDTTILISLILLFVLCFIKTWRAMNLKTVLLQSALIALIALAKLPGAIAIYAALFIFALIRVKDGRDGEFSLKYFFMVVALSASMFALTWGLYCFIHSVKFSTPFTYIYYSFFSMQASGAIAQKFSQIARNCAGLALWLSPYMLIMALPLFLFRIIEYFRDKNRRITEIDFIFILSGLMLAGYLYTGGVTHSFPKYHPSTLPLFAALVSLYFFKDIEPEKRGISLFCAATLLLVIYNLIFVKDLVYLTEYRVREQFLAGDSELRKVFAEISLRSAALLLPGFLLLFAARAKKAADRGKFLKTGLFSLLFASNISLNLIQMKAG
ncbi:MAG: hypothetical protein AAB956_03850, partial [Patescibacteria group bacterium]